MELADLDMNKVYTYADYYKWKFDERVELIKGKIFRMSPAPNRRHQELSSYIYVAIYKFLEGKGCKVYYAPFDVRIPRKPGDDKEILTVLQPDICVVCDEKKLDDKGCLGAPDIVVEILSPGNNSKEMRNKYEVYEEAGVPEYWIISPQNETFLTYTLTNGKYIPSRTMATGDIFRSSVLSGLSIDLAALFNKM